MKFYKILAENTTVMSTKKTKFRLKRNHKLSLEFEKV